MRLIKNGQVLTEGELFKTDILIDGDKILKIAPNIEAEGCEIIDADGLYVLPGLIDVHVHLRQPGHNEKETIKSGSLAAAKGGFTTICSMPNVIPFPDNVKTIKEYLALNKQDGIVNIYPHATMTLQEAGKEAVDFKAIKELGINFFSDDGVGVQNDEVMKEIFDKAKMADVMIVAHTEDMKYRQKGASVHAGKYCQEKGLIGIPSACESEALIRDLKLLKPENKYHACHISAKESVEALRQAKLKGLNVSGEVTAHHLLLEDKDVINPNYKMNPPLRSHEDRMALIEGLENGSLDFIASDHAPHTAEEKSRPMDLAPFGIVSLETSFAVLYTTFVKKEKRWTLAQLVNWMAMKPAQRFGFVNKGEIKENNDADIILVDLDNPYIINVEDFTSKGHNTPFDGQEVYGKVIETIVAGRTVFKA